MRRAATFLQPVPLTTPDVWARSNRRYKATAGIPGPRNPGLTPYLIPFARKVHEGRHRYVVAVTAAQAGKTDTLLDCIGARLEQRPVPILYVGPSIPFVRRQFEPRLMELFEQAPRLASRLIRGRRISQTLKIVNGVPIRLASAGSSTDLKSDPFGLGVVDEYDEMVANIRGQGDPLGLIDARGDSYADSTTAVVSTCSRGMAETEIDPVNGLELWRVGDQAQIESPIWRLWQQGTRHHFAWCCPHCAEWFVPRHKYLQWPKGATPAQALRSAFLACPHCGGVIEDHHKAELNAGGVMVAPGQTIEQAFRDEGVEDNTIWSCWTSGLCSPLRTFGERAEQYLTAELSGEEDKKQTAMNAGFGELFTPGSTGDVPDWSRIADHRRPYLRYSVPRGVLRVVAGVDVQKASLVYVIRGFGSRGTSWLIDYGYLYGRTDEPDVWNDLTLMMTAPVGGMIIEKVFIDSGFRPNKVDSGDEHRVYEWARRNSWIAMPTKGRDTLGGRPYSVSKIEVRPDGTKVAYSIDLVHINTDFFKGLVHSRLKTPLDQPGAFYLFDGPAEDYEDYARQLVSEVRVIEIGMKPKWITRALHNHFLDAEALAAAAAYTLNVQSIPEGVERQWGEGPSVPVPRPAPAVAPDEDDELVSAPSPAPAPRSSSIRDRFRSVRR